MSRESKLVLLGVLLLVIVVLPGCAGEYLLRTMKPTVNSMTKTVYQAGNYDILGPVSAKVESVCILGVYEAGTDGQGALWTEAQLRFPGKVTGLKDVSAVYEYVAILAPIYCKITTTFSGLAVQEKK